MDKPRIFVVMTGGTIDSEAYIGQDTPEYTIALKTSGVPNLLKSLHSGDRCDCFQWIMRDSKLFTERDLKDLAQIIKNDTHQFIIVTHGTDAMIKNAKFIRDKIAGSNKTVFFTGAMKPLTHGQESEGPTNLQFCLDEITHTRPGVYIVGREEIGSHYGTGLFDVDKVTKDFGKLVFVRQKNSTDKGMGL